MLDPVRERCAAFHLASHLLLHPLCFSFPDLGGTLTPTCIGKPPTRALGSAASTDSVLGRCSLGPPSLPCPVQSISGQVWPVRCLQLVWCPAAGGQGCGRVTEECSETGQIHMVLPNTFGRQPRCLLSTVSCVRAPHLLPWHCGQHRPPGNVSCPWGHRSYERKHKVPEHLLLLPYQESGLCCHTRESEHPSACGLSSLFSGTRWTPPAIPSLVTGSLLLLSSTLQ